MTADQWDVHWGRIYNDALVDEMTPNEAVAIADRETEEQWGPRPEETK